MLMSKDKDKDKDKATEILSDTDDSIRSVSRFGEIKNVLNWSSKFYETHTAFSLILIFAVAMYLGFKTFGLTPLRSINSMINHSASSRRWTKICSYHIIAPDGIDEKFVDRDVSDIVSDIILDSCDFYHIKGRLSDAMKKMIEDSKVIITISE